MWHNVCELSQLDANIGTGALVEGQQVALFYLPNQQEQVFAIDNWDPIGKAFVLSRGIVGDVKGQPCVASPLYKQHFDLKSGSCVETPDIKVKTWRVRVEDEQVWLQQA
ncbi:nitrite reductase small subunit NirD [Vibrio rumoiensis]|uniref:Nitrite reductase small subunit n=1 Tax=Vibrio rumoiensis 1S-45 TaxID=1188252 RepID=A0A1E5DZI8_9VIBR|nr:nitrite reductase small subunit NirD [Vibrio rumoiensis]OEF23295.1 nitrite reductase small subunit [Vibrio rumoiensis 1S-45]